MASGSPPASSSPSTSCWVSLSVRASSERPCQKRSASASSSRSQRSCSWQRPRRQPHWDSSCAVRSWIPAGHERDGAQPAAPRGTARDPAPRQCPEQGRPRRDTPCAGTCCRACTPATVHAHPPTGPCLPLCAGTSGSSIGVCCLHAGQQLAALCLDCLQGHPQLLQLAQGQAVLADLLPKVGRVATDGGLALQAALQPLQALQQQVHALGQLGKVRGDQPGHLRGSPAGHQPPGAGPVPGCNAAGRPPAGQPPAARARGCGRTAPPPPASAAGTGRPAPGSAPPAVLRRAAASPSGAGALRWPPAGTEGREKAVGTCGARTGRTGTCPGAPWCCPGSAPSARYSCALGAPAQWCPQRCHLHPITDPRLHRYLSAPDPAGWQSMSLPSPSPSPCPGWGHPAFTCSNACCSLKAS